MVEVIGAATALGLMALYLAALSRGVVTVLLAAGLITLLLFVTFDLDRPTRVHQGPGGATRRAPCLDGASPGGAAHPQARLRESPRLLGVAGRRVGENRPGEGACLEAWPAVHYRHRRQCENSCGRTSRFNRA